SDIKGTPRYMAPELFASGAVSTKASDVYSLGVLLFYLVSGKFLVEGKTLGELKRAHQLGQQRSLREICPHLTSTFTSVVTRAVDPSFTLRPSIEELQQRLVTEAMPASMLTPRTIIFGALLLLAGVAALWPLMSPRTSSGPTRTLAVLPIENL